MGTKIIIWATHLIGIPSSVLLFMNLKIENWMQWVLFVISSIYLISNVTFAIIRGVQSAHFRSIRLKREKRIEREHAEKEYIKNKLKDKP